MAPSEAKEDGAEVPPPPPSSFVSKAADEAAEDEEEEEEDTEVTCTDDARAPAVSSMVGRAFGLPPLKTR